MQSWKTDAYSKANMCRCELQYHERLSTLRFALDRLLMFTVLGLRICGQILADRAVSLWLGLKIQDLPCTYFIMSWK